MREIEFSVVKLEKEKGRTLVSGRCCKDEILVGDSFSTAYGYPPVAELEEYGRMPEVINKRPVNLRITRIESYQRNWEMLDSGLTATVILEGYEDGAVKVGEYLGGVVDNLSISKQSS